MPEVDVAAPPPAVPAAAAAAAPEVPEVPPAAEAAREDEGVKCCICQDVEADVPSALASVSTCIHTFHARCYYLCVVIGKNVRCPMCRKHLKAADMRLLKEMAFENVRLCDLTELDYELMFKYDIRRALIGLLESDSSDDESDGE